MKKIGRNLMRRSPSLEGLQSVDALSLTLEKTSPYAVGD